jgi:hypothetical protein
VLGTLAALVALTCDRIPSVGECEAIVVDMPHGEWRIHVAPDGSGRYAYGALPAYGRFGAGTFDFRQLHATLVARVSAERELLERPYGTVQFCVGGGECGDLWFFSDRQLAAELFDAAYRSREAPRAEWEREMLETVNRFWDRREPGQP